LPARGQQEPVRLAKCRCCRPKTRTPGYAAAWVPPATRIPR